MHRSGKGAGSIISRNTYRDFDMKFEWKISKAGNSGIKYRSRGKLGLEYQILDDEGHKDAKTPSHRAASLYALVAAPDTKPIRPAGEWNQGRIRVKENKIQHWLNGEKVVDIDYGSKDWTQRFEASKYAKHDGFGSWLGPVLLQDHGDEVWFRNFRIREL